MLWEKKDKTGRRYGKLNPKRAGSGHKCPPIKIKNYASTVDSEAILQGWLCKFLKNLYFYFCKYDDFILKMVIMHCRLCKPVRVVVFFCI